MSKKQKPIKDSKSWKYYDRGLRQWDDCTHDFDTVGPTQDKLYKRKGPLFRKGSLTPSKKRRKR